MVVQELAKAIQQYCRHDHPEKHVNPIPIIKKTLHLNIDLSEFRVGFVQASLRMPITGTFSREWKPTLQIQSTVNITSSKSHTRYSWKNAEMAKTAKAAVNLPKPFLTNGL